MLIRTYMRLKYLLIMGTPNLILLVFVFLFKENTDVLAIITIIFAAILLFNYLIMFSRRFFVYQDYVLVQQYFSKHKIMYIDVARIDQLDHAIKFILKDGSVVTYQLNGFIKKHQLQLFIDLARKINKDILL